MTEGWDATGLLAPLWSQVGGRDGLAALTGIHGGTLSGYNTGRLRLGLTNAERIAAALGVSLLELGQPPEGEPSGRAKTLLVRLEELAAKLAEAMEEQNRTNARIARLRARVKTLEDQQAPGQAAPTQSERR